MVAHFTICQWENINLVMSAFTETSTLTDSSSKKAEENPHRILNWVVTSKKFEVSKIVTCVQLGKHGVARNHVRPYTVPKSYAVLGAQTGYHIGNPFGYRSRHIRFTTRKRIGKHIGLRIGLRIGKQIGLRIGVEKS